MTPRPHAIVLDAHALTGLAEESKELLAWAVWAKRSDSSFYVSTLTLAETTDGSARDARIRREVKMVNVVPVTEQIGYAAGRLRARAAKVRKKPRDLTVDAVVAATAMSLCPPVVVLTCDKPDLDLLLDDTGVTVEAIG